MVNYKKRKARDAAAAPNSDTKRQKTLQAGVKQKSGPKKQVVTLDNLNWKDVDIPNELDDYEGFFGLEEVEDVEVIREGDTGLVTFKSAESKVQIDKSAGKLANGADDRDLAGDDPLEEEWTGFSDENDQSLAQDTEKVDDTEKTKDKRLPNSKAVTKNQKQKDDKVPVHKDNDTKTEGNVKGIPGIETLGTVPFGGLEEEALDDGVGTSAWAPLNLSTETLSALSKLKFSRPTRIQSSAIPEILAGHDVIGKASTGSGKTLAFGIPILETYLQLTATIATSKKSDRQQAPPLALILSPTRELAHQIGAHLTALCSDGDFSGPRIVTVTGGLSIQKQERQLLTANIVIGTPGRLWEVMSSGHGTVKRLKEIRFLVLDEADRLLSQGHFKEVEEILTALDRKEEDEDAVSDEEEEESQRQTLVFSATFHKGLQQKLATKGRLSNDLMTKQESLERLLAKVRFREEAPKFIDANPISQMAEGLREGLVECGGTEKDLYLYALLVLHPRTRTLIFTNSIAAVRRLTPYLQNLGLPAQSLHSSMAQKARMRAVERFKSAESAILVATDVAARGLDIADVHLVLHYHLPRTADMYVHRSGRTARAENKGASVLLCAPEEVAGVRRLVARVHSQSGSSASKYFIRSLDIDRRVVSRLKPRATLAKKIADVGISKEKGHAEDKWLREAAEELGVEYDSEEMESMAGGKKGRGSGRRKKEREEREIGREDLGALKAELKGLLAQRVNLGISERYLASGIVDVDALLRGDMGDFLGAVNPLDLET